jgi:hypothetical protein
MRSSATTLERFVRRVHRRWVVLRALEAAGVGAAVGCAAGLALVPVLLWRDRPAFGVAMALIAVAGAAGLIFGLTRRPTLLAAAVEADRQLALHDLLASALASRHVADEWAGAVVAQAEARCRSLSPDVILLNRLGVRSWSGIGLAAALVMTLSLLSTRPDSLSASRSTNVPRSSTARASSTVDTPASVAMSDEKASESSSPRAASRDPFTSDPAGDDSSASASTVADRGTGSSDSSTGVGSGAAQTDDAGSRDARSREQSSRADDTARATGETSSGGRGAGESAPSAGRDVSGSIANGGAPEPVAPWTSHEWAAAQRDADEAVETGRVPDAYRELVRDYFAPEP